MKPDSPHDQVPPQCESGTLGCSTASLERMEAGPRQNIESRAEAQQDGPGRVEVELRFSTLTSSLPILAGGAVTVNANLTLALGDRHRVGRPGAAGTGQWDWNIRSRSPVGTTGSGGRGDCDGTPQAPTDRARAAAWALQKYSAESGAPGTARPGSRPDARWSRRSVCRDTPNPASRKRPARSRGATSGSQPPCAPSLRRV